MPYATGEDLVQDVLFRSSEPLSGSDWQDKALDYLNRAYRAVAAGSSEFLPEIVTDWWWLRQRGVLIIKPVYQTGTVDVTQGSTSITFSDAPTEDLTGYRLLIQNQGESPIIQTHMALEATATLDAEWTGDTLPDSPYKAMKVEYDLDVTTQALLSPIHSFTYNPRLFGTSPEGLDALYPLQRLRPGIPQAFALQDESTIRMSHGGREDGKSMRMEYWFRPVVTELDNTPSSVPLLPLQYRQFLADAAITYLLLDKDDDRAAAFSSAAKSGFLAMEKENRRRFAKIDQHAGWIFPRPRTSPNPNAPLRPWPIGG